MNRKSILATFCAGCAAFGFFIMNPAFGINALPNIGKASNTMVINGTVSNYITIDTSPFNFTFEGSDFDATGHMVKNSKLFNGGLTITASIPIQKLKIKIYSLNGGLKLNGITLGYSGYIGVAGVTEANYSYKFTAGTDMPEVAVTTPSGVPLSCLFVFAANATDVIEAGAYTDTLTFTVGRAT